MPKTLPLLVDTSPICCTPLAAQPKLTADDAVALAVRLKAIADPTRLQLVAFLLGAPNREACTCDLAPVVGLSEATVSHHLRKLLEAGVVTKRRDGMNVWYRLVPESLSAICRMLDPACC
ncbi:metalloregulator ArsR/SmtB family transcription factor [Angustibacter sp. McL0619]|uniref:metalloregulator ArsR/SmtB family transcription factor n=1 Tax=Angustibacter sp. McL0619 TaxID=3415676 RepID=UPI003CF02CF4